MREALLFLQPRGLECYLILRFQLGIVLTVTLRLVLLVFDEEEGTAGDEKHPGSTAHGGCDHNDVVVVTHFLGVAVLVHNIQLVRIFQYKIFGQ
jgi:hypothetical protein